MRHDRMLVQWMRDVGVTLLTPAHFIQCLTDFYNAGYAYSTANLLRSALALSCRIWMVRQPYVTDHPSVKAALLGYRRLASYRSTRRSPIRHARLLSLIRMAAYWVPPVLMRQVVLAFRLGYAALLRISELLAIRRRQVSLARNRVLIFLPSSKNDQMSHGMTVVVRCPIVYQQLAERIADLPPQSFVFTVSSTLLNHVIRLVAREAHWEGYFSFHSLRHGRASDLWEEHHSLPMLMAAGRWLSMAAARIYIHVTDTC